MPRPSFADRTLLARLDQRCRETAARELADLAEREHARVLAESRPSEHRQSVDGRPNAPFAAVKPNGKIFIEYSYFAEIAARALEILRQSSPVDSGKYRDDHGVYINGALSYVDEIGMARRMVIANTAPYARVIEVGIGKRVPWSKQPQVPREGVYKNAVRLLRRQYSSLALIRHTWVGLDENTEVPNAPRTQRYPAIVVEAR